MEHKIEVPTTEMASLLSLHEHCLLDIFELLELDDLINLAKTSSRLREVIHHRTFKKFSKFELDKRMIKKGEQYINHLISMIGQHVLSLSISPYRHLSKIINECKHLKSLRLNYYPGEAFQQFPSVNSFDKVELLELYRCNMEFTRFLQNFHNLKSFNILKQCIEPNELKTVFQNNPNIQSFFYSRSSSIRYKFNWQLLELIPNVERLRLDVNENENISELNSLLKLNRLKKLQLICPRISIDNFLLELARKETLDELHLESMYINDNFFDVLPSFNKLQLLFIVSSEKRKLNLLVTWPTTLKRLRLSFFELTHTDFVAMIRQLKHLEHIDLLNCYVSEENKIDFTDLMKLSQEIRRLMDNSDRKQSMDVFLPHCGVKYDSMNEHQNDLKIHGVIAERLRISNWSSKSNPLTINIQFPCFKNDW